MSTLATKPASPALVPRLDAAVPSAPVPKAAASLSSAVSRRWTLLTVFVLAVGVYVAYQPAFDAPFILDDEPSIASNPTLSDLWPLSGPLSPPKQGGLTVEGRPILNLSLALNYHFSGVSPRAYRLTNVAIHLVNGLLLFGLIRRTLTLAAHFRNGGPAAMTALAGVVALCWLVHPMQTAAVTYVIQRAESLCAFFYLLTLYAFVRGATGELAPAAVTALARRLWFALSFAACAFGMGTKEVMVSAPVIVLLYDRSFLAGSWRGAVRARGGYYLSLAATWMLLAALVLGAEGRGGSAGMSAGVPVVSYALTQCWAVLHYLRLAVWPSPLVFDYGTTLLKAPAEVVAPAIAVLFLLGGAVLLFWLRRRAGFVAVTFFALLAPSSSIVPIATQTMAEHRMYLPLAAVLIGLTWLGFRVIRHHVLWLGGLVAVTAAFASAERNALYNQPIALWTHTVEHRPENTRARNNLALLLRERRDYSAALVHLDAALAVEPGSLAIHNNRANVLADLGRHDEALAEIDAVLRAVPNLAEAHDTKADILRGLQRHAEADRSYAHAIALKPSLRRSSSN